MKALYHIALLMIIFAAAPATAQETSANFSPGSIKFNNYTTGTCDGSNEGALKYSTTNGFEICNGSSWQNVATGADLGAGSGTLNTAANFSQGSIKIGNDTRPCVGGLEGSLRYTGGGSGSVVISSIAAGDRHSCGIGSDNKAYCWGRANNGRLGNGATSGNQTSPAEVLAGASPGTFKAITAGLSHTCAIGTDDKAYCWGSGAESALGNNTTSGDETSPVEVLAGEGPGTYTQITSYEQTTCAIGTDDRAYCWGDGSGGLLASGASSSNDDSLTPTRVRNGQSPGTFKQIAPGSNHTCAIGTNDVGYCWGNGGLGRLGRGSTSSAFTPRTVSNGDSPGTFKQIATGIAITCAVGTDDKGYCWGNGDYGQRGDSTTSATQTTPREVQAGQSPGTFKRIDPGFSTTCAIGTDDKAYCFGRAIYGHLGNGETSGNRTTPREVSVGASPGTFTQLSNNTNHACTTGTDNKVYCWGEGANGRLGDGNTGDHSTPIGAADGANTGGLYASTGSGGSSGTVEFCDGSAWTGF